MHPEAPYATLAPYGPRAAGDKGWSAHLSPAGHSGSVVPRIPETRRSRTRGRTEREHPKKRRRRARDEGERNDGTKAKANTQSKGREGRGKTKAEQNEAEGNGSANGTFRRKEGETRAANHPAQGHEPTARPLPSRGHPAYGPEGARGGTPLTPVQRRPWQNGQAQQRPTPHTSLRRACIVWYAALARVCMCVDILYNVLADLDKERAFTCQQAATSTVHTLAALAFG